MSPMPPPNNSWNAGFERPSRKGGLVGPMLVGGLIFAVGCGSGLAVGWFAGITTSFIESPEGLGTPAPADTVVNYTLPDSVSVGEPFVVRVTLTEVSGDRRGRPVLFPRQVPRGPRARGRVRVAPGWAGRLADHEAA